ncbi:WD40 repeat [Nitrosospira sp. Nl5]|uniref:nSTAND1 domain-containing NTPase n=1 Tax=Nitrosospira sp. Nl5 TaxID=200120 RepID=UPI0008911259|nr:TIR domain-containing protein [Nitrosospira sp. Nl5]SCY62143.1 WD40 repeat [Nitrosospira sp. Nl5]
MAKIFLSHASQNNREALAMKLWLESQGWKDEVFLDFDLETGIKLGKRWKDALAQANKQSQALLCLTSADWISSSECVAEYRTAENFNVPILVAQIGQFDVTDKTREWQGVRLFGEGSVTEISLGPKEPPVHFLADGLARIRLGLLDARISGTLPETFPWPPTDTREQDRDPYRGLEPLDVIDAGIYFGRDAEILQGLAELEKLRLAGDTPLFVILGASGTGKSSFLRAGLISRLERDERRFYPLTVVRPESSPIFGDRGLAQSIHYANQALGLTPKNLGEIKAELGKGAQTFKQMLRQIQDKARKVLVAFPKDAPSPTLVLPIDQAEELFITENKSEAEQFLNLIGNVLHADIPSEDSKPEGSALSLIVAFTIRSDRYAQLQTAKQLTGLKADLFDSLKPMPSTQFKEIIERPAERATRGGHRLEIRQDLVKKLLEDYKDGADTLPLLSLTLSRLYRDFSEDGDLKLDEYETMGGLENVINSEIESILDVDPDRRQKQLEALHDAFIPHLVTIDSDTNQPIRKIANLAGFDSESCKLIQALINKRLLLIDSRGGRDVVEIAHESLLRLWKTLKDWLAAEKEDLRTLHTLEREALAWKKNNRGNAWLIKSERLANAEALFEKPRYKNHFGEVAAFLTASRLAERLQQEKEERQRQAEIVAAQEKQVAAEERQRITQQLAKAEQRKAETELKVAKEREDAATALAAEQTQAARKLLISRRYLQGGVFIVLAALLVTIRAYLNTEEQRTKAVVAQTQTNSLRLVAQSQAIASGAQLGGDERAILQLLAAWRITPASEIESELLTMLISKRNSQKIITTQEQISAVAFSPDGNRIVSGGGAKTLQLWDANTGRPIGEPLRGHKEGVTSVAFSPDGSRIVSGSSDSTLRLWDAKTGRPLGEPLRGHKEGVTSVAFSPDGSRIVSGSSDSTLRLWDARTGQPVGKPLQGHKLWLVASVAFSPDGTYLVSGSYDRTLQLWNASAGQPIGKPLHGHENTVESVAFSPDGSRILSGSSDRTLRLWDARTGQPVGEPLRGHKYTVESVAFSPDGSRIVSGSSDSTLRLWDASNGRPIGEPLRVDKSVVSSVAFSPDGSRIVSGSRDGTVRLWVADMGQPIGEPLHGHEGWVTSVAFSRDGTRIVTGSSDDTLRQWNANTGQPIGEPLRRNRDRQELIRGVLGVALSYDGIMIVSGNGDTTLQRWNARTGRPIGEPLHGHKGSVESVAFSPDGDRIVSGSGDKTLRLWDAKTGRPIGEPLCGHEDRVMDVAFSPDGSRIISGSEDKTLRLWDAKTGKPIGEPLRGQSAVWSVAFSPDGNRIISGSSDSTLRLWDARSGSPIGKPLQGHKLWVTSVAFSPDGTYLVSGSYDRTLQLWNASAGQPIGIPIRGHENEAVNMGAVLSVAFSPDGTRIASGGMDKMLRLWPRTDIWPDELCRKLMRNMSYQEWREWVSPDIPYVEQCPGLPVPPDDSQLSGIGSALK